MSNISADTVYKIETTNKIKCEIMLKNHDCYLAYLDILESLRQTLKYKELSDEIYTEIDKIRDNILQTLEDYNINLDILE